MAADMWSTIHAERHALAEDLAGLKDQQWQTPSLCSRWNVLEVLGHMTSAAKTTPPKFFAGFLGSGFNFDAYVDKGIARETAQGPAATLAEFQRVADNSTSPPGPKPTWLGEVVMHSEDIRRPLGIKHEFDPQTVVQVADFYKGSNAVIGSKNRIQGVRLVATDTDWSHGNGPVVRGPILALTMAMTGRPAGLDDLSGDGVDTLRQRMPG